MIYVTGIPGRTAEVQGEAYLFFSGFAYLGMPALPAFQDLLAAGADLYGAVFPSSRLSNTRTELYESFETKLAEWVGLPRAVSFSSGYMASQAAVSMASQHSELLYSPGIHPSLKLAGKEEKEDLAGDWRQQIVNRVNQSGAMAQTIVMESVNPLTGEIHDFSWLAQIQRPVRLLVDDSHGIGILGQRGEGIMAYLPANPNLYPLICFSLSKAFCCQGGAVTGHDPDISAIKKLPFFSAATGMSPMFVYAWMKAGNLFDNQRIRLLQNMVYFHEKAATFDLLSHDARLPVCYTGSSGLYEFCLGYRILLSAFHYPSADAPLMVRIVLNALHTGEDMDRLIDCISYYQGE